MLSDQLVAAPSIGQTIDPVNGYLGTVGALLQAYDAIVNKTEHAPAEVADWLEENVALALAGRRWLVGSTDPFQPEVVAVDEDGEVVAGCGLDHDLHE